MLFTYTNFRYHLFLRGDANVSIQPRTLFKTSKVIYRTALPFNFIMSIKQLNIIY